MCVNSDASRPINIHREPCTGTLISSLVSDVWSVQITVPRRTSRLGSTKPGVHLVDSKTSESLSSIALRLKCTSTTVTLNLCYCTAQNAGEWLFAIAVHAKDLNILWPDTISNNDLYQKTGCLSIDLEIKKRRLRWLGHVIRRNALQFWFHLNNFTSPL